MCKCNKSRTEACIVVLKIELDSSDERRACHLLLEFDFDSRAALVGMSTCQSIIDLTGSNCRC